MTKSTTDIPILDEAAIAEIEARHNKADSTVSDLNHRRQRWVLSVPACPESDPDLVISASLRDIPALCATVRALRADLKYRREALDEIRRCRDRWLTMLNPASADETVDGAIRNLQQAYISERDNATHLQSQLEQVTKERDRLKEDLRILTKGRFIQS